MPEVDERADIENVFERARRAASKNEKGRRQVIFVTPGRLLLARACPLADEFDLQSIAALELLAPPERKRNIVAIAYTDIEALKTDIYLAVPFWDFLSGLAAIGHSVWVFEGHNSALEAGCRAADLLLVDEGMLPFLEEDPDWRAKVQRVMRRPNIRIIPKQTETRLA